MGVSSFGSDSYKGNRCNSEYLSIEIAPNQGLFQSIIAYPSHQTDVAGRLFPIAAPCPQGRGST